MVFWMFDLVPVLQKNKQHYWKQSQMMLDSNSAETVHGNLATFLAQLEYTHTNTLMQCCFDSNIK